MDTLQPDDFILGIPTKITGGRITVSSKFWPDVDTISVQSTDKASVSKSFPVKVQSVKLGRATAIPTVLSGSKRANPGKKIKIQLKEQVDGVYTAHTPSIQNINTVFVPTSELGAQVQAKIYHIRSGKAIAEVVETIKEGLKVGECIGAKLEKGSATCVSSDNRINDLPIELNKPAIVGGKGSVRLTQITKKLQGVVEEYPFLPRIREKYSGKVFQGSTEAKIDWPEKADVPSVELEYPADATMNASIEIIGIGNNIQGRVLKYHSIPEEDETIKISVERGNDTAYSSLGYYVELESEAITSGKALATVTKSALPASAKISEYNVVSSGDVVNAKLPEGQTDIAQPYTGDFEILLEEEKEKEGYTKVRILRVDESGVYGREDEDAIPDSTPDNDSSESKNPFMSGGRDNRSDLISGRKL